MRWASSSDVPGPELDVQIDVAAGARLARAQLVVADHAARRELLDRLPDRVDLLGRQRLVDQHPREPNSSRTPVTTIAAATASATTGSIHWAPVILTRISPTRTPPEVSASVRRWAASPASAGESVRRALRAMIAETTG